MALFYMQIIFPYIILYQIVIDLNTLLCMHLFIAASLISMSTSKNWYIVLR